MQEKDISSATNKIKQKIEEQYPSVREFARQSGIPHGTIVSALSKGIEGMAWSKVVQMCACLNVDCVTFEPIVPTDLDERQKRLLAYYDMLDPKKQAKVMEYIEDIR